jgi:hypothetical protein
MTRDGSTEARAKSWCRCGHYSYEHEQRGDRGAGACYLCECAQAKARKSS